MPFGHADVSIFSPLYLVISYILEIQLKYGTLLSLTRFLVIPFSGSSSDIEVVEIQYYVKIVWKDITFLIEK